MKKLTSPGLYNLTRSFSFLVAGVMVLLALTANVGRAQTNFASAEALNGYWGVVTNDNTGVTPDIGAPNIAGFAPRSPLWYQWTAPQDGVVTMDTIGSVDDLFFAPLNTVLAVYTGSSLTQLNQVAANDNIFPVNDEDSFGDAFGADSEGASTTQVMESGNADYLQLIGGQPAELATYDFVAPYYGPSGLRFNAVGGQTYYFAVDSESSGSSSLYSQISSGTGLISLNWAYQPSGVFRFASEDVDPYSGLLLYQTSQTESLLPEGTSDAGNSTVLTYYDYNALGVLVTVTRTAGSTGRAEVNYTTVDGTELPVGTNDEPAFGEVMTNFVTVTNVAKGVTNIVTLPVTVQPDYTPASGTLVFDDFEMSKTILIHLPVNFKETPGDQTNRVFGVQLSNPVSDPGESGNDVSQPRVDPTFSTAMVRILNDNADPYGPDLVPQVVTNAVPEGSTNLVVSTNMVVAAYPTNVVFNFEKANYRVPADVNNTNVSPWTSVTLWVERFGTNTSGVTLNYQVNAYLVDDQGADEEENIFYPLQPGSDYAVPSPPTWSPIRGTNTDFVLADGTLTFPSTGSGEAVQPLTFTIPTSSLTKFNKDFKVELYHEVNLNNQTVPELVGMINEATVTILFNDQNPPAGSVDEFYNADFNNLLALYSSQVPVTTPPDDANPGVGIYGEVYSLAMLTNNEALIGGDFQSYNGSALSDIALVNTNGQLDASFNTGGGADGAVNAVALNGNQFYVGGSFSSFNSQSVGQGGGIVRLNANGSVDGSFNPGLGPNASVRAMAVLPNGEVLVGGDFTSINQTPASYLALLNTSGKLDTSFNPGTNINGSVYALQLQGGQVLVGGDFGVAGQTYQNIARLNMNGSVDPTFIPGTGADSIVRALALQSTGQIIVGGEFAHFNGSALSRIAELNADGSLNSTNFFIGSGADNTVFSLDDVTSYLTNITYVTNATTITTNDIVTTNISIYVGGTFDTINGTHRLGFARLYSNGTVDTTFMDTSYNQFAGLKRIYSSDTPGVFTTGIQTDGNVLIGGSFNQVGGGQANSNVCDTLDVEEGYYPESFNDPNLWVEPKTRDGVRNRSGLARLIGGSTAGPGNIGLNLTSYSADKSQSSIPNVSLVRTNGTLGPISANFSVQSGTANSGQDYTYYSAPPLDWVASQFITHPTRQRSDGLFGQSGALIDPYGLSLTLADVDINNLSLVDVNIIDNKNSSGNLDAQFQLANPSMADTFYLGGEEIPVGSALGVSSAPLTLVDDTSAPGTFGFSSATYVATNLSAAISVVRSNGVYGVVTMRYSTTNGTALAGTDYVGITNQNMVFESSQTSNSFNVTIKNDGSINNVEKTIYLSLYDLETTTGAEYGISNAVLRIINPNFQGYLTLGATNYTGTFSSGVLNFTVNRISGSEGTATVQYATTNGSATSGTDYIGATNTLTWSSGDVSPRVVSIPLINPNTVGANKQFSVSLFNPTLNSTSAPSLMVGEISNATLVISNDNSYGTVQFSQPTYTVSENGGYATITAVRTGGYAGTVSVNYATANGANTASGVNYSNTTGVLVFAPDQTAASFTVPVINDGVVDPANFYFNVLLSDPTNAVLGSLTNVQINLLDVQNYNQPPGTADPSFNTNGMNSDVFGLTLETNGQILAVGSFTAVGSTPAGGIARLNTDGSLDTTFLNGLSGADAPVNTVVCQTDSRVLVGGSFTTLDGYTRNFIGRLMTDGTVDTSFNPGAGADGPVYAIAETFIGGNREIYVGGTFGNINGVTSQGLSRLNNDGSVDTSFVTGTALDGQAYAIAVYPTNSIAAGKVLVGGSFAHYNGVALTNFARLNANGSVDTNFVTGLGHGPDATVSAIAIQVDGSVLVGGDFTNFNGTPVNYIVRLNPDGSIDTNFTANTGSGANGPVQSIALQSDNRIMLGGEFTQINGVTRNHITRLLPTGAIDPTINLGDGANGDVDAVVIQPTNGMIVIGGSFSQYNDQSYNNIARIYGDSETGSGQFEFSSANYQVNESAFSAPITIRRTGGTSGPNTDGSGDVYVTFSTTNGTAAAGTNYNVVNESVAFPPGEVLETVAVPVINNLVIGPSLTVSLELSDPTPPASLGDQPTATLTILNDNSAISFSSSLYTVDKNVPTDVAAIDIIRQGDTNDIATVLFYTTTNGTTAIPGTDYHPTNEIVTFNPGQSDVQVQVPIINNNSVKGNTTVGLVLTNASTSTALNAGVTFLYAPSNAVLTIIDTTSSFGSLAFSSTNFVVNESAGTANLTVVRTNGSTDAVTVNYTTYTTTNDTAQPGVNYVASSGELTINNNSTSGTITIALVTNNLVQPPVTFSVALSDPQNGASLIAPSNTTVTIISDNFGVDFVSATNYVAETNTYGYVSVQRIGSGTTPFSVNYATVNGTALSNVNYQAVSGTLSFGSSQTLQTIPIPLINNHDTTNLMFGLVLSDPTDGAKVAFPSNAVVVIQPSMAGLSFTNSTNSVSKNDNYTLIAVVCSNPSIEPVPSTNIGPLTVNFSTANGTAEAGVDYTATNGTLTFTNGLATNYFRVSILNNSLVEGNRTFSVNLSNPSVPGKLAPPSTQLITIVDDNSGLSFSSPTYTVLKTNGVATITVLRTDYTNTTSSVTFETADGTAVAGEDYVATNGTFVFTNGQTAKTFSVAIIGNSTVQPDKTVLLQLFNATNGFLVAPYAATLTIHDTSGSLVVPAGSVLVAGSTNGIINPGGRVSLLFGFRASGGTNATDVLATLLATNGISSPTASQNYGTLIVNGPSASREFTFTANGTNSQQIAATFQLQSAGNNIGIAIFTYSLGTWTTTFYNTNPIIINSDNTLPYQAIASPYPSFINVTNVGGDIIKVTATLTNINLTSPSSVAVLLVSPVQEDTLLMANAGAQNTIKKVTLTFDDASTNTLPYLESETIVSGTNKPTAFMSVPPFP